MPDERKPRVSVDRFDAAYDVGQRLAADFSHVVAGLRPGDVVAIKANMFVTTPGYHTHLGLLTQAARFFAELGAKPVVVERLDVLGQVCAREPELQRYAEIRSLEHVPVRAMAIEGATSLRLDIGIPAIIPDCDLFVSAPQFRSHAGVLMSNAMKNLVGILPGYTTRMVHNVGLSEAIVDLNRIHPPELVIADLITTIEGNYPISGVLCNRDIVLVADNVVAADLVAADLSGFDATQIEYLELAARAGLGPRTIDDVEVLGDLDALRFTCIRDVPQPTQPIELAIESACVECQRYCRSIQELLAPHVRPGAELLIAAGPAIADKLRAYPAERTVIVGNCAYTHRRHGIYLEGCPPRALQARAVADFLANGQVTVPLHRNQCRWPSSYM
ncbi:MAG TPA: DUF362 domain-containing protein [Enhygromyxa sp.]|nr:DUF362 domain-containing protein [Enhygromyxa sp.]